MVSLSYLDLGHSTTLDLQLSVMDSLVLPWRSFLVMAALDSSEWLLKLKTVIRGPERAIDRKYNRSKVFSDPHLTDRLVNTGENSSEHPKKYLERQKLCTRRQKQKQKICVTTDRMSLLPFQGKK